MPKKIVKIFLSSLIIMFSFFYTNTIIKTFREKDPIYIEIKRYEDMYLDSNKEKIDIEESYKKMKKTGSFNKNLMVFKESSNENDFDYKSYINSLNSKDSVVSIVFVFKNTDNILSILNILDKKNVKATFFLDKDIFDKSIDIVKLIDESRNQVELLSNTYSIYEVNKYNSILKLVSKNKLKFCINNNKEEKMLESCESSKLYTISPNIILNNNIYLNIKNKLYNGSIIEFDNSNNTVKELSSAISYIIQKGKKCILLKNIVE